VTTLNIINEGIETCGCGFADHRRHIYHGQEAVRVAKAVNPKIVIPMHRSKTNPLGFDRKVEAGSDIKVVPLQIGEVFHV
jgi:L-ascorbate metabolism protein UlaG (beta-lactamase superfamily)